MKTFKQHLEEAKGDFGTNVPTPKPKCYGKTTYYKAIKKRVCAYKSSSSRGGDS